MACVRRAFWQLTLAVVVSLILAGPTAANDDADPVSVLAEDKFLYFAYGSNLLARRLLIRNPTAQRFGVGQLKDYRIDFSTPPSKRWGGAPATVVPDPGEDVWGAIWSLDIKDRDHLDEQEGVGGGWYDVFNATVLTPGGRRVQCRCYMMHEVPPKVSSEESRPAERQPSLVYKQVMLTGAGESGLPADYVARLRAVRDNGSRGVDPPVTLESLVQQTPAAAEVQQEQPSTPVAR